MDFVACATMQIGMEFVKKKGRGKPLPWYSNYMSLKLEGHIYCDPSVVLTGSVFVKLSTFSVQFYTRYE